MVREVKFVYEDKEALLSLMNAADYASATSSPFSAYSVNVRKYLKVLLGDDFSNEIPKGDTFASIRLNKDDSSVTFSSVDEGACLTSIHKLISYVLEYLGEFEGYCIFGGKRYSNND